MTKEIRERLNAIAARPFNEFMWNVMMKSPFIKAVREAQGLPSNKSEDGK